MRRRGIWKPYALTAPLQGPKSVRGPTGSGPRALGSAGFRAAVCLPDPRRSWWGPQIREVVLVEGAPEEAPVQHAATLRTLLAAVAPSATLTVLHWTRK